MCEELLNVKQTARLARVSYSTIRYWNKTKKLFPFVYDGIHPLYKRESVQPVSKLRETNQCESQINKAVE